MQRLKRNTTWLFALGAFSLLWLAAGSSSLLALESGMRTKPNANEVGIWKSYVPHGVKGEFDNYDPVGLMAGVLIHADCSINWRDPDTDKLFCFTTGTSFNYFQDFPKANAKRANEAFQRMRPGS